MNERRSMLATYSQDGIPGSAKELTSSYQTGNVLYLPVGYTISPNDCWFFIEPASGTEPAYLLDGDDNFIDNCTWQSGIDYYLGTNINYQELGMDSCKIGTYSSACISWYTNSSTDNDFPNLWLLGKKVIKTVYNASSHEKHYYISDAQTRQNTKCISKDFFNKYYVKLKFDKDIHVGLLSGKYTLNSLYYSSAFSGNYNVSFSKPIYIGKESRSVSGFDANIIKNLSDGMYALDINGAITSENVKYTNIQAIIVKDSAKNKVILYPTSSIGSNTDSSAKLGCICADSGNGAHDGFTNSYPNTTSDKSVAITDLDGKKNCLAILSAYPDSTSSTDTKLCLQNCFMLGNTPLMPYIGGIGEYNMLFQYKTEIQSRYGNTVSSWLNSTFWTSTRASFYVDSSNPSYNSERYYKYSSSLWSASNTNYITDSNANDTDDFFPIYDLSYMLE